MEIILFGRAKSDTATVVRLLAEQVRRDISFGELPPDTKLKIDDLRRRYGGSAHSFREALTLLSVEGLVEASAQRGFRVASATQADLEDITRLRAEIECLGLDWAMQHGDVRWEAAIIAAHHTLSKAEEAIVEDPGGRALEWDEANREFHARLIAACGSPRLTDFQERLFQQSRRFRLAALREGKIDFARSRNARSKLVEAIVARDRIAALEILSDYIKQPLN